MIFLGEFIFKCYVWNKFKIIHNEPILTTVTSLSINTVIAMAIYYNYLFN